ncbi:N-acetyltransferase domain-containing protein [Favolaschia claudopus]|uniref:N-acetyltransferase domain-containing protein n=1 Tax=Favolaschia claudopus TaxID=2862362 RepID=A0AAW0B4Q2_9AGAR
MPLERNPSTEELFLRLPVPYTSLILTPPRPTDAPAIQAILRDPAVYTWLGRPSSNFSVEEAQGLLREYIAASNAALDAKDEGVDAGALKPMEDCPVRSIREVQPDGSDVFVGHIGFKRCKWFELALDSDSAATRNSERREKLVKENDVRVTGDPDIVWQVSSYLSPTHHRRGIMTVVLRTLLDEWAIPRMRMHHIHVSVFTGNEGSVRMLEKCGFVRMGTMEECIEVRGERRSLHVLDWERVD